MSQTPQGQQIEVRALALEEAADLADLWKYEGPLACHLRQMASNIRRQAIDADTAKVGGIAVSEAR